MNRKRNRTPTDDNASSPANKLRRVQNQVQTLELSNVRIDLSEHNCKINLCGHCERKGPVERIEIVKNNGKEWLTNNVTFVGSQFMRRDDGTTLEQVNDPCLMLIMSHLPLIDAIHLGKTSTRLQSVSRMFYRKYQMHFSFRATTGDSSINERNLPVILEQLGAEIRTIDWYSLNAAQFGLLVKHCPNVTKIKLSVTAKDLTTELLKRNKQFFAHLKTLHIELSRCSDRGIKSMMSGGKLRTLELRLCRRARGEFLNSFNHSKLKNVKIMDCPLMKDITCFWNKKKRNQLSLFEHNGIGSLSQCLKLPPASLGQLKELHLDFSCFDDDWRGLNFSGLKKVKKLSLVRKHQMSASNCNNLINLLVQINNLESLNIREIEINNYTIECLELIKRLKHLRMDRVENTIGSNLYGMLREHLSTLEQLSISFLKKGEALTGKFLFDLIAGMPKLNYFSHSSITWEVLDGLLQTVPPSFFVERQLLKIGVPLYIFKDPKKETFDAKNKGIALTIHK